MNYSTETEHEAMGQRQRTEDHLKVIFAILFIIYYLIINLLQKGLTPRACMGGGGSI